MGKYVDISGERFGKLVAVRKCNNKKGKRIYWECLCDCGNVIVISSNNLRSGHTKSCGCFALEMKKKNATKHNMCKSRIYKEWNRMIDRCRNTKSVEAHRYVLRGITVCDEWKNSFETFMLWSLENGYDDNLSIDRIDNDKGYSPDNCRWVDRKTQCRNKSNNIVLEYNGEKKTLVEWAELLGIKYGTLHSRIYRDKLSAKEAFEKPLYKK